MQYLHTSLPNKIHEYAGEFSDTSSMVIDNFLPANTASGLFDEIQSIEDPLWKTFTRNGSYMLEMNKVELMPKGFEIMSYLHSPLFLTALSEATGIDGLMPDPYLIGAGYSKIYKGHTLKVHTDFNWNETLKLHRALSLIIYLTPEWEVEWNGGLEFYNESRDTVVKQVDCLFNRCVIWKYNKLGWHGHSKPLDCPPGLPRTTLRLFYYVSNSTHNADDPPHRSQYWIDPDNKLPFDKKTEN